MQHVVQSREGRESAWLSGPLSIVKPKQEGAGSSLCACLKVDCSRNELSRLDPAQRFYRPKGTRAGSAAARSPRRRPPCRVPRPGTRGSPSLAPVRFRYPERIASASAAWHSSVVSESPRPTQQCIPKQRSVRVVVEQCLKLDRSGGNAVAQALPEARRAFAFDTQPFPPHVFFQSQRAFRPSERARQRERLEEGTWHRAWSALGLGRLHGDAKHSSKRKRASTAASRAQWSSSSGTTAPSVTASSSRRWSKTAAPTKPRQEVAASVRWA